MLIFLSAEDLPGLKADLRKALPGVPSSHRMEALARATRHKTYASLRAAIQERWLTFIPEDGAGNAYLRDRGFQFDDRAIRRCLIRLMVKEAMEREPQLTASGFGLPRGFYKTTEEWNEAFKEGRAYLLSNGAADEYELASIFLSRMERRKTVNRSFHTYNLKHRAENISRKFDRHTHLGNYVCNGILIAAALTMGFRVRRMSWDSLSAYVNISSKSYNAFHAAERFSNELRAIEYLAA